MSGAPSALVAACAAGWAGARVPQYTCTMSTRRRGTPAAPGAGAGPNGSPPSPRRVQLLKVAVTEVIAETGDTVTLVFDRPPSHDYRAGQWLTIDPHQFSSLLRFIPLLERLKGRKEPPRAYSMASAPHERLAITIKEETWTPGEQAYPTLLSPYLVHDVRTGMPMTISGFSGPYHLPDDIAIRTDHIVHVCEGSGIVPNWSIVKAALRDHPRLRHTMLYSNTSWDDVIFRDALHASGRGKPGSPACCSPADGAEGSHRAASDRNGRADQHRARARGRTGLRQCLVLRVRSRTVAVGSAGGERERHGADTAFHGARPRHNQRAAGSEVAGVGRVLRVKSALAPDRPAACTLPHAA